MKVLTGALLAVASGLWVTAAGAGSGTHATSNTLSFSADYGITADDNITRAELDSDVVDDTIITLEGTARYAIPINAISYAMLRGTLGINRYLDFDKMSNNRLGVDASYIIKPVRGFTAPEYFIRYRHEARSYDSDKRDGSASRLALGLSKRISELLSMQLGFTDEEVDADDVTFDTETTRFYIDIEYRLNAIHGLYMRLARSDGDIVATTVPTTAIINASTSITRDDAFLALTPARWAYKLDAETLSIKLGDAIAIDRYQGLDISMLYYDTDAGYANNYSGLILSLFYRYNF